MSMSPVDIAVKQTPFTAMLSPVAICDAIGVVKRKRKPEGVGFISATSPIASISPVNIRLSQPIGPQPPLRRRGQPWQWQRQPFEAVRTQHMRGHIHLDAIDKTRVPDRAMKGDAPFNDDRRHAPSRQAFHRLANRRTALDGEDFSSRVSEGGSSFGRRIDARLPTHDYDWAGAQRR